jgi:flavin-dependent dehydrogenase
MDYDVLIIGSGPAGQQAAWQAARMGKRDALDCLHQLEQRKVSPYPSCFFADGGDEDQIIFARWRAGSIIRAL